ncbi:MAG: ribonuclease HII [Streptococcaceae bacterium]|jgi:ribonuclease HII|nr:ribonuclease HII [Streptococcaceae bacterium]
MTQQTIKDIKERLAVIQSVDDRYFQSLISDERRGVQQLLSQKLKAFDKINAEAERMKQMFSYERSIYARGFRLIAGIDEVGRGPLAGPVVAAAVILPQNSQITGLNDSKQIPKKRHRELYEAIKHEAVAMGIGIIPPSVIDKINIYEATKLAMLEAIEQLSVHPDYLLIDAMKLTLDLPQLSLVKGDAKSASIAAASVIAKVTRDELMNQYAQEYPEYQFEKNAGYGTKAHLETIEKYGILPIHRQSFEPIKSKL